MLCANCIRTLYRNLSPAAVIIIKILVQYHDDAALNLGQIIKLTGLSISITRDALAELRGAMMVTAAIRGRGIYYALAEGVAEVVETETVATGEEKSSRREGDLGVVC